MNPTIVNTKFHLCYKRSKEKKRENVVDSIRFTKTVKRKVIYI